MRLKSYIMLAIVALCSTIARAADDTVNTLVITLTDETTATYSLAEMPVVTFDATDMIITSEMASTRYQRAQVKEFHFEQITPEGIHSVQSNFGFSYTDNHNIRLTGLAAQHAELYDTAGKRVGSASATDGSDIVIALQHLPAGTYILRAGQQSIKIQHLN